MRIQLGFFRRATLELIVGLLIGCLASSAALACKKGSPGTHTHRGRVVAMNNNSITIRVHHHKRGAGKATTENMTFNANASTVVRMSGNSSSVVSARALRAGQEVAVEASSGFAKVITIHQHHSTAALGAPLTTTAPQQLAAGTNVAPSKRTVANRANHAGASHTGANHARVSHVSAAHRHAASAPHAKKSPQVAARLR